MPKKTFTAKGTVVETDMEVEANIIDLAGFICSDRTDLVYVAEEGCDPFEIAKGDVFWTSVEPD